MKTAIRKIGNSHGVMIPKSLLAEIGVRVGDKVELPVTGGKIVIAPLHRDPRRGWAADSKRLAGVGQAGLAWPEFANDGDKHFKW